MWEERHLSHCDKREGTKDRIKVFGECTLKVFLSPRKKRVKTSLRCPLEHFSNDI